MDSHRRRSSHHPVQIDRSGGARNRALQPRPARIDLGGQAGKTTHASIIRLTSRAFELLEDVLDEDPRYLAVLAAISAVHRPGASPADYARAAVNASSATPW
ncbi:DUF6354 family protein [Streptomyces sp. NPDC001272]